MSRSWRLALRVRATQPSATLPRQYRSSDGLLHPPEKRTIQRLRFLYFQSDGHDLRHITVGFSPIAHHAMAPVSPLDVTVQGCRAKAAAAIKERLQ